MSARTGFTILVCFLSACTGDQVIVRTNTVVCGNGELETGEECDDNNDNNFDACTNACEFAACGDGVVRNDLDAEDLGYEECDDGNDNNNDYCRNDCLPAICGDGIIRTDLAQGSVGFEACDDANIDPNDECTNECKRARCGDGFIRADVGPDDPRYEECDDGNDFAEDACTTDCRPAVCGDDYIRQSGLSPDDPEWEDCEDLNDDETDDCRNCRFPDCRDGVLDRDLGEECDDGNEENADGCDNSCRVAADGRSQARAAVSCRAILEGFPEQRDGLYWIDPDGGSRDNAYQVHCDLTMDGGGWTLVAVVSDDDQNNWTWQHRAYWTVDESVIGRVEQLNRDFKSPAYHQVPMQDILVKHEPSGIWSSYSRVGDGGEDLGSFIDGFRGLQCHDQADGIASQAGMLAQADGICNTKLYFNCGAEQAPVCGGDNEANSTYGLCFSVRVGGRCDFSQAWRGGFGPNSSSNTQQLESNQLGFGQALGLNTGRAGQAQNYIHILVRD
ncbi:MAG: DUF4215 domain-containing protein [Myxococcota bacterium]|jgi:cysteine-rich repeat protein|nr:DUF4215 domain-containing protein [Myxococcota bacterium]